MDEKEKKKRKIFKTFQILSSWKFFPYVGIKKCCDKEMSKYNMNPSQTTNHTYISRV